MDGVIPAAPFGPADLTAFRSTRPGFGEMLLGHAAYDPAPNDRQILPDILVAEYFDPAYYSATYDDVRLSDMDPLEHFLCHGAAELRNPNDWFDLGFYVRNNADVVDADLNPFWHYLAHGRAEGRAPSNRRQAERAILARAAPARDRPIDPMPPMPWLDAGNLVPLIEARMTGTAGFTLCISHDRYTEVAGGVQILVSDEQLAFNARQETYLHLCPAVPRFELAAPGDDPFAVHVTLDGAYAGVASYDAVIQALTRLGPAMPATRHYVVHCLLGHRIDPLIALHAALGAPAAVFWVNDYEAICVGYNLLRNDVTFCGGPPPGSLACRVCIQGDDRDGHLAQLGRLFAAIPFHVVAPSRAALAVWTAAALLPHASVQVHEYVRTRPTAERSALIGATPRGTPDNPVRVAFVGYAVPHKGWAAFVQLAAAIAGDPAYRAFHFTTLAGETPAAGVEIVPTRVTAAHRGAMTDALVAAAIDLVIAPSTWPETFCLVAYEATAAGADVVTVPESGNVADMVLGTGRGVVVRDTDALLTFFTSHAAVAYVRMCGEQGSAMGRLESRGMTATLPIPAAPPASHTPPTTPTPETA